MVVFKVVITNYSVQVKYWCILERGAVVGPKVLLSLCCPLLLLSHAYSVLHSLCWVFAVSENKALCHPSSVDSLSTSAATEDHVSMGGWAARKALRVIEHVEQGKIKILISRQTLDHENEKLIPIMIRCEVGRYNANFSRQKTVFQSAVILLVFSCGLWQASKGELPFLAQALLFSVLKKFSDLW